MKHCSLNYAIKTLTNACDRIQNASGTYWGYIGRRTISFIANGDRATCFHTQETKEKSDPSSDYYPGSYWPNLKQAIEFCKRNA